MVNNTMPDSALQGAVL